MIYNAFVKKRVVVSLIVIVFVLVAGYLFWNLRETSTPPQNNPAKKRTLPKEVTVTLDKNGYSPEKVTITVGSAVRWKNESGEEQTVNSDNYPFNQLHKELNFGTFADGSSVVYTFTKSGRI